MSHLGLLVKTASRIQWAFNLAEAAADGGKKVWVHFAEHGVCGLRKREIESLSRFAKVSICMTSAERLGLHPQLSKQGSPYLTSSSAITELIRDCDRYVVL